MSAKDGATVVGVGAVACCAGPILGLNINSGIEAAARTGGEFDHQPPPPFTT